MFGLDIDEVVKQQFIDQHPGADLIVTTNGSRLEVETDTRLIGYIVGILLAPFLAVLIATFLIITNQIPKSSSIAFPLVAILWVVLTPVMIYASNRWMVPWLLSGSILEIRYYWHDHRIYQLMLVGSSLQFYHYTTEITTDQLKTLRVESHPKKRPKADRALVIDGDDGELELLFGYNSMGGLEIQRVYDHLKKVNLSKKTVL